MSKLSGYEANRLLKKESKRRKGIQPVLESGVDVKTINGETIVGSGNLDVAGGGGPSAPPNWGEITGSIVDQIDLKAALDAKQATLVSGSNIKTVNGESILGSGNIAIAAPPQTGTIGTSFDGGGDVLIAGSVCDVFVPYGFTISKVTRNLLGL